MERCFAKVNKNVELLIQQIEFDINYVWLSESFDFIYSKIFITEGREVIK
jgi:hypothetical protein